MINRYVVKLKPSVFKHAVKGNVIINESDDPEEKIPAGFIAEIFNKTKSIEICLFRPLDLDTLKIDKKRVLYYEQDYDVDKRFKELKQQGY